MTYIKPSQALNKAYRQLTIETDNFYHFKDCLKQLFTNVNDGQIEETQKVHLQVFLANTFYSSYYMAPEGDIDLAVHLDKTEKSNIGLLIEVKSTTNKSEMISVNSLNKKALQELLLYYLRERVIKKNSDLKYLISTNIYEYFIFDAQVFEKYFYNNKDLRKEFIDFEEGRKTSSKTDFFYNEIASKYIDEVLLNLEYTYFDLREYKDSSQKKLIELYKIFSNIHLLKLPFQTDSNSLNKNFYTELLYIIGLEEKKEKSKTIIVRKEKKQRNDASLIEATINALDSEDRLDNINDISQYGSNYEDRLFNVAMELCITWINRILFLKLLEAQLIKYHNGDKNYKFLTISKIKDFDDLQCLFFQVLARNYDKRTESILKEFKNVPYLNSSLFEISPIENSTICINCLPQSLQLPLLSTSVLKKRKNTIVLNSLPTLNYFFEFLDAYNFSSDSDEDIQDEAKTLINASVLGLIFEKINGHKEGSVFTPGFITMYMSHESVRQVVVNKFNEYYGWTCKTITDLYNKIDNIEEANFIINNIKICDPAVGSGHYLVSVLNEIIQIKYELSILKDGEGRRIKKQNYSFSIENDELIVTDEDGTIFSYNPSNIESQRIQELLFNEKRYIIEHCLFGVDINPNSVNICRLRLWIELLKNAYYTKESNYEQLETLPNIDINIKCGNSLLHRFDLNESIKSILKESNINISEYKDAVEKYRATSDKSDKKELANLINKIKSTLKIEINKKDRRYVEYKNKCTELESINSYMFELNKEQIKKKITLQKRINQLSEYFNEIKSNNIYLSAFEWRIEFPEVLDEEGNFIGFDCVIGNPPYMRIQEIRKNNPKFADYLVSQYISASGSFDIYVTFIEHSLKLINDTGFVNFIMPVKWANSDFGKGIRKIASSSISKIIDFDSFQVFDASTYTALQWFNKKSESLHYIKLDNSNSSKEDVAYWLKQIKDKDYSIINSESLSDSKWSLADYEIQKILDKLYSQPRRLSDIFEKIYQGIATSKDDVYFLYDCILKDNIITGYSKQIKEEIQIEVGLVKPLLKGEDVHRFLPISSNRYIIFPYKLLGGKAELYTEDELSKLFPLGYNYLKRCEDVLRDREKGRFNLTGKWFQYGRKQGISNIECGKLLAPEISLGGNFSYDINGHFYSTTTIYGYIKKSSIQESYMSLLALLNSQVLWWFLVNTGTTLANGYFRYKPSYLYTFPVPYINNDIDCKLKKLVMQLFNSKDLTCRNNIEQEINSIIYNLYNLSDEEIKKIETI